MSLQQILQEKRQEILAIAAKHGAYNVRIFGSVARGEADEQSDVDILVELEEGRSLFDLGGLLMDLEESFRMPGRCCDGQGITEENPRACA